MSWLSKAWRGVKGAAKKVGSIAKKAAPALAFIPGVGTATALAIGGIGGLVSGGAGGALEGLAGAGAGLLGKAALGGKLGSIADLAKRGLLGGGSNPNGFDMGDLGSIAKLAGTGLGLYSGYKGYQQSQADSARARELNEQAVGLTAADAERANALWASLAPLREQYVTGVQGFRDSTNPFAFPAGDSPILAAAGPVTGRINGQDVQVGGGRGLQEVAAALGPGGVLNASGGQSSPGMIAAMATPAMRRTDSEVRM